MWNYIWPILMVVAANTFYNICAKSTPGAVEPFASLTVTYLVAAALSVTLFFATAEQKNLFAAIAKTNWTSLAFGVAIIGLEFGYLNVYRAGWKVSVGPLVANVSLACVLVAVGALLYRETVSFRQVVGMALCVGGIFLISR